MNEKRVSVYIPTHNRSSLLERAIKSVINQTYKNVEILICDDGSSDDTQQLVERYQAQHDNIVYLKNETPKGACAARNLGINAATGHYITGLDDDDEFLPERIEKFVKFFERHKYPYLSSGIIFNFGKHQKVGFNKVTHIRLDSLLYQNIVGSQVFTKTDYLRAIGGFDESFKAWQDYDTWVRLGARYGEGYNICEATYIQHLEHEFGRITKSNKLEIGYNQFVTKHRKLLKPAHRKNLLFNYKMARDEKLSMQDLMQVCYPGNVVNVIKYQARKILM